MAEPSGIILEIPKAFTSVLNHDVIPGIISVIIRFVTSYQFYLNFCIPNQIFLFKIFTYKLSHGDDWQPLLGTAAILYQH